MQTIFPSADGYSGIFIRGLRSVGPAATEEVGAAIVKRSFTVVGGALAPDPAGEAILTADDIRVDGRGTASKDDDIVQVRAESDLVPRKRHGDVIVLGHHGGDVGGRVEIDPGTGFATWLQRIAGADVATDPDTAENLFGWHPRLDPIRLNEARPVQDDFDPAAEAGDIDHFYNAHRRTAGGFTSFGRAHAAAAAVRIFHAAAGGAASYAFAYAFPALAARYFAYCGCGPDREAYWGPVELGAMTLDTLVIRPGSDTVSAVWRASWPWGQVPADAYRRLVVEEV